MLLACVLVTTVATKPPAHALPRSTILPGYWESTSRYSILVAGKSTTTRKCLTRDTVDQWLTKPEPKHFTCDYGRRRIGDAKLSLDGTCSDSKGHRLNIRIRGTYGPEQFHLTATGELVLMGVPLPAEGDVQAHRLSDTCPAPDTPG